MPTVNTTLYLSDIDYVKYLERKDEILDKMREFIRQELGITKVIVPNKDKIKQDDPNKDNPNKDKKQGEK